MDEGKKTRKAMERRSENGGGSMKETKTRELLLDELLARCETPEDILGREGLLASLQNADLERALEAEMTAHLGYEKHAAEGRGSGNSRNGHSGKKVLTGSSEVRVRVPRDRNGSFRPQLLPKRQSRLAGFEKQVVSLYARNGIRYLKIGRRLFCGPVCRWFSSGCDAVNIFSRNRLT